MREDGGTCLPNGGQRTACSINGEANTRRRVVPRGDWIACPKAAQLLLGVIHTEELATILTSPIRRGPTCLRTDA